MTTVPIEMPTLAPGGHSTTTSTSNQSSAYASALNQTPQSELSLLISQIANGLGQQVFNWANTQVAPNTALTNNVVDRYLNAAGLAQQGAEQTANATTNMFLPEYQQLANTAAEYGSAARQQVNAGQASANSVQGTQNAINQTLSQLEGFGVDPSSGAFPALLTSQKVAQGAAAASSGTQAALQTQATGRQLQGQAVGVGEQLPGMTANFLNSGAANLSGAENSKLANTSTQAGAFNAATPFEQVAQNLTTPQATTAGGSQSSSSSYGTNFTQANPQNWLATGSRTPFLGTGVSAGAPGTGVWTAGGGAIPEDDGPTMGGHVDPTMSPSNGAITDDVNGHLNTDEFVVPRDVAKWKGQEYFQNLILDSRKKMQMAPAKPQMGPPGKGASFVSRPMKPQPQGAIPA